MVEVLIALSALVFLSLAFGYLNGKASERLGEERAKREMAELSNDKISRGIKKIMGPRPNRNILIKHWKRRLRKSEEDNSVDGTLPDTNTGDD